MAGRGGEIITNFNNKHYLKLIPPHALEKLSICVLSCKRPYFAAIIGAENGGQTLELPTYKLIFSRKLL